MISNIDSICEKCIKKVQIQHQSQQNESAQENNSYQQEKIYIKCKNSKIILCKKCCKQHLLNQSKTIQTSQKNQQLNQELTIICQECQKQQSSKYCSECEEHLCQKCSFKIHNKGKRAKHSLQNNKYVLNTKKIIFSDRLTEKQKISKKCLFVYEKQQKQFESQQDNQVEGEIFKLQVNSINEISIQQIQNWLHKHPLLQIFDLNQKFSILKQTILINGQELIQSIQVQNKQIFYLFLKGHNIQVQINKNSHQEEYLNSSLNYYQTQQDFNSKQSIFIQENVEYQLENIQIPVQLICSPLKCNPQSQSPQSKKFFKKHSENHSEDHQIEGFELSLIQIQKPLKKALKIMNNKSLIIQIPQLKQYKQSPIKSDREQVFLHGNLDDENSLVDKTLMINFDENYNQLSGLTQRILQNFEDQDNQISHQSSILMMGNHLNLYQELYQNENSRQINNNSHSEWNSVHFQKQKQSQQLIGSISVNLANISTSTQNSIRKKSKKLPIPYFQPFKFKQDNLNNSLFNDRTNSRLQKKMRELAQTGILMIGKDQTYKYKLNCEDKILRKFKRLVCEQEVEYVALHLDTISIQSIIWTLQSIKQDKMTPTQKLVLSRLKESFNIKLAHKLWLCILKYLQSPSYITDKIQFDKHKKLPQIVINRLEDQILLEYDKKWLYQDQEKLNQNQIQWNLFVQVLNNFFQKKKQITGGRYGCVQYVKRNGPEQLKKCSLGRISMYVQQAINKGIIRYHKTLLIPNNQQADKSIKSEQADMKLLQIQKDLKILILKCALIDMFLQAGPQTEVSLAQIPLTFKKIVLFEVNLLQLGFPKLKNLLQTISNLMALSSSKSHIKYQHIRNLSGIQQLRVNLNQLSLFFISKMYQIITGIMKNKHNIIAQQLYYIVNEKIGFNFDFKVCNVPDFYQFLIHYCHQSINLQFINGVFVAFTKNINFIPSTYNSNMNNNYQNHNVPCNFQNYNYPYFNQNHSNLHFNNILDQNKNWNQNLYGYPNSLSQSLQQDNNYQMNSNYQVNSNHQMNFNYQVNSNFHNYNNYYSNTNFQNNNCAFYKNETNKNMQKEKLKSQNIQNSPYHHQTKDSQISQISTPKFNSSIQYITSKSNQIKTINNFKWQSYFDILPSFQKQTQEDGKDENQSFTDLKSIYNIIDDQRSQSRSKVSCPKTVIEKEGSFNNMQNQLYISKITPIDEKSDYNQNSIDFLQDLNRQERQINLANENKYNSKQKGQHNRVYSTAQARTKHQRMYSTTTSRN